MYLDIMNHPGILIHTCFPGIIALTAFCDENLEVGTKKVKSKRTVVLKNNPRCSFDSNVLESKTKLPIGYTIA